jgi:Uma2 family endonuclease
MATLALPTVKMTRTEFEAFVESQPEGYPYYELHDGELIKVSAPSEEHQRIAMTLITYLVLYLANHPLGEWLYERPVHPVNGVSDYIVDVGFYSFTRFPDPKADKAGAAPDIAVEIYSPSNTYGELENKALDYLESGSRLVWIVYPNRQQVHVYHPDQRVVRVSPDGVLEGGDVLPGFTINMAEFWAKIK